ncbi:MAG: pyridoxamine 5'-phosphate oxidase family protein, partial [Actinomycetota bacterium]
MQDPTVPYDVAGYLSEHLRPAQVSAVSPSGSPLLGSLWFLWADRKFWFSSVFDSPLVRAFQRGSEVAVLVDDFSPPADIRQVRVRGPAGVEVHDPDRVEEIYVRYLGADLDTWPVGFRNRLDDLSYVVWSVTPVSGLVASFAHFKGDEA